MVVGASRGLGRGITTALAQAGVSVVALSRTATAFPEPTGGADTIQAEVANAGDPTVAASLLDRYEPEAVILVAGASPHMRPLQHQTWETFSVNWETDVRIAFHWLREALLKPLRPGSRVEHGSWLGPWRLRSVRRRLSLRRRRVRRARCRKVRSNLRARS
jgi:NAD(P)-dependent dehydrogenase (short-subunit alcohol dehydrogenase family)